MLFSIFGAAQTVLLGRKPSEAPRYMSFLQTVFCGAVAGVGVAPLVGPMELVKTQLQVKKGRMDAQ